MIDRRIFVKTTCTLCFGAPLAVLFNACDATRFVSGTLEADGLSVATSEFQESPDKPGSFRPYIIVRNEKMEYPISLYRFSETEYSALLMKCTHQGTELQAAGDQLHCSAHGSEFSNNGKVTRGPAETNLRSFPVLITREKLLIQLK